MAVIREKKQFAIGPIGIARSSSAGQIIGEQVARSANQAQQYFFRRAVEDAQQAGVESAQALEASEITALDPDTGRPKSYDGPKGMGRYALKAYQKVLLSRFEQEIASEIESKSKELALKHRRSPEAFKSSMSEYIAGMSNVEESTVFKNEIVRIGNAVQNQKYIALQSQAIARQERNDAILYKFNNSEASLNIEDSFAAGNDELGNSLILSAEKLDADNIAAGTILSSETIGNAKNRKLAKVQGQFRYELNQAIKTNASRFDLESALNAIDSGDLSGLSDKGFNNTYNTLVSEGATFTESFAAFATELLQDGLNQTRLTAEMETRKRIADDLDTKSKDNSEYFDLISGANSDVAGTASDAVSSYMTDLQTQLNLIESGATQAEIESITSGSFRRLNNVKSGVINNLFAEATSVEDVVNIQKYLANPTSDNLNRVNEASQSLAITLTDMARSSQNPQFLTEAISYAEGVSDEVRFSEFQTKTDNALDYNDYLKGRTFPNLFSAESVEQIELIRENSLDELNKTELQAGDREKFESALKNKTSESFIRFAFSGMTNPKAIEAAALYARDGVDPNNLVSSQRKAVIDKAREAFDDSSAYGASVERYSDGAKRRYNLNVRIASDDKLIRDAFDGTLGEATKDDRVKFGRLLSVPDDFYTNSKYDEPEYAQLTEILSQTSSSIWPQAQVDTINSFLNGNITDPDQIKRVLVTYAKASEFVTDQGLEVESRGSSSLTSSQKVLMDEAVSFSQINTDPTALAVHMQKIKTTMGNPALKAQMNDYFKGEGVKDAREFVANNFPEARMNANLFDRLLTKTRMHYFKNAGEIKPESIDDLISNLQSDIDKNFVEDNRIITLSGSSQTLYPLSVTAKGNEQAFMDYIRSSLAQNSPNKDIDWNSVEFKLTPVGYNDEDGGMTYGVVIENETGGRDLQEVSMQLEPDTEEPVIIPAFFSTNEPFFAAAKQKRMKAAEQEQVDIATEEAAQPSKASVIAERTQLGRAVQERLGFGVEYKAQVAQKKFTQQEAMDELRTIVDVDKYESLSSVKPAMLRSYGRVGEVPFNQSLIALSSILSIVKRDKNPLARQLEVDLKSMISIINGVED
jgi:hypothetical protein